MSRHGWQSGTLALALVILVVGQARGEDIPRDQHPWGRFAPGSWCRIRVSFDGVGSNGQKIQRVELVTTRLLKVDVHGVTLQREILRGKKLTKQPAVTTHWDGTLRDGNRRERISLGEVKFKGKSHSCQTHSVTRTLDDTTVTTKSWYSPDTPPHFLKRLIRVSGPKPRHTAIDVISLKATRKVGKTSYTGWETRTVVARRGGRSQVISFHSEAIPGGLVQSKGERHDSQSARIGSTIEKLDAFHAVPVPDSTP